LLLLLGLLLHGLDGLLFLDLAGVEGHITGLYLGFPQLEVLKYVVLVVVDGTLMVPDPLVYETLVLLPISLLAQHTLLLLPVVLIFVPIHKLLFLYSFLKLLIFFG